MATKVRDIITEAFNRANIVPRKRDLPADNLATGLNLFKGILQDLSNKKYVQAYKSECEFTPKTEKSIIGPYVVKSEYEGKVFFVDSMDEDPNPNDYEVGTYLFAKDIRRAYSVYAATSQIHTFIAAGDGKYLFDIYPDVELNDLMTPVQGYFKESLTAFDWVPMPFISYDQLYSVSYGDYVISWKPIAEGAYEVYVKPRFLQQKRPVKIIYNIVMDYKDNDVVSLPTPYIELLTRALAYKIAITYPRVDATKMSLLKNEYDELTANLEASNASQRILTRECGTGKTLMGSFLDGSFISDRWY